MARATIRRGGAPPPDNPLMIPNRRAFSRVRFPIAAVVTTRGVSVVATVRDLSLSGVGLQEGTHLHEDAECMVTLRHVDDIAAELVAARGVVIRARGDGTAIHFLELLGVESYHRLRMLILLNAEDPAQVEREFASHWGLRPKQ